MIYLLTREGANYEENRGFVVRAPTHEAARKLVDQACRSCDDPSGVWLDPDRSKCTLVEVRGPALIVLVDNRGA